MNANAMGDELELKLDRSASFGSPGYEDFEKSSVLTEAERLYVKKYTDKKNNRKGESLEETEARNQGLSALIKRGATLSVSSDQTGTFENGTFFDLPLDFMYTIHEEVLIDKIKCNTEDTNILAEVRVIAHDEVSRLADNKYKKPYYKSYGKAMLWRMVFSREIDGFDPSLAATAKRHQLVTDGTFNAASYSINYLQNPKGIIVDNANPSNQRNCILDDSAHNAIIDIATSLMLGRVKEQEIRNVESFNDVE